MATKNELAEAAKEVVARERALAEESNGTALTVPPVSGVHALAQMSDEAFEQRLTQIKTAQTRMARVQREYMTEEVDYGTIPGTPKPTLFKSGAEKLAQLYNLTARIESEFTAGDGTQTPPLTYDSQCFLHVGNFAGPVVAVGHGTANAWEKRYRYRRGERTCPSCGMVGTVIKGKAEYGGGWLCWRNKGGCNTKWRDGDPAIEGQVVGDIENPDPYDLSTTLQKISEKRAFVDAVLRSVAASGLFTQDLLDEPITEDIVVTQPAAEPEPAVRYEGTPAAEQPVVSPLKPEAFDPAVGTFQPQETTLENQLQASIEARTDEPPGSTADTEELASYPVSENALSEEQYQQVLARTGGEEVVVGPSAVENVERGGRTQQSNEAQINEVRRLAAQLGWGAKVLLGYVYAIFENPEPEVPADGRNARSVLTGYLETMNGDDIGRLITSLRQDQEMHEQKEAASD